MVDGLGPWEGRLEINLDGRWGAVCDTGFGDTEADVVCRMLGYIGRLAVFLLQCVFFSGSVCKKMSKILVCVFCLSSRLTIFQSCWDEAPSSWVFTSTLGSLKCLAQRRYTAVVGFECWASRYGVRRSTTEPPRPQMIKDKDMCVSESSLCVCSTLLICNKFYFIFFRDRSHKVYKGSFYGPSNRTHFDRLRCMGDENDISQCAADFYSTCSRDATVGLSCGKFHFTFTRVYNILRPLRLD